MNKLANINSVQTMTSREIADLTGKRHDNVIRDVKVMFDELGVDDALKIEFLERINNLGGKVKDKHYVLNKEETLILVSGYSIKMRAAIIKRWQELEDKQPKVLPGNFAQALRLAADLQELNDHLLIANRELNVVLSKTTEYYDVTRVLKANPDSGLKANTVWRPLKKFCEANGLEVKPVFCDRFGKVNAYPREVWEEVYPDLELPDEAGELIK